jgi:hypothetical protein
LRRIWITLNVEIWSLSVAFDLNESNDASTEGNEMAGTASFMKVRTFTVPVMFFALAGLFAFGEARAHGTGTTPSSASVLSSSPPPEVRSPQTTEELEVLDKKCVETGERLEGDVEAKSPGRTWTWRWTFERSRQQLDEFRRDLKAFRNADIAFERSLSPQQRSRFAYHLTATQELFDHLERDAQSLDNELRKGYPRRWHVADDVSGMRKEIQRWRKLHRRLADELGLRTHLK